MNELQQALVDQENDHNHWGNIWYWHQLSRPFVLEGGWGDRARIAWHNHERMRYMINLIKTLKSVRGWEFTNIKYYWKKYNDIHKQIRSSQPIKTEGDIEFYEFKDGIGRVNDEPWREDVYVVAFDTKFGEPMEVVSFRESELTKCEVRELEEGFARKQKELAR